jgi:hypothetical protein
MTEKTSKRFRFRLEKMIDEIIASSMQSYEKPGDDNKIKIRQVQLVVKIALVAAIVNIPGFVMMQIVGSQWPFFVWFLGNMLIWGGRTVMYLLNGFGGEDKHSENDIPRA